MLAFGSNMKLAPGIWIILLPAFGALWAGATEITVGQLYEQKGYWRQDGVVLLLYRVPVEGELISLKTRVRLLNSLWMQVWEGPIWKNGTYFKLKSQWKYEPKELGIDEITLTPVTVSPADYVGFFIITGVECPLAYELIEEGQPGISIYGSGWLNTYELPVGNELAMGSLGYRLKYAIEYHFDGVVLTTPTEATTLSVVITSVDETPSTQVTLTRPTTISGGLSTNTSNPYAAFLTYGLPICVFALMGLATGGLYYFIKRRRRKERRPFIKTNNPIYGVTMEPGADRQIGGKEVRNGTVSSGVYAELNEKEMDEHDTPAVKKEIPK